MWLKSRSDSLTWTNLRFATCFSMLLLIFAHVNTEQTSNCWHTRSNPIKIFFFRNKIFQHLCILCVHSIHSWAMKFCLFSRWTLCPFWILGEEPPVFVFYPECAIVCIWFFSRLQNQQNYKTCVQINCKYMLFKLKISAWEI